MLAAKYFDDVYFTNAFYADVGGISVDELNMLSQSKPKPSKKAFKNPFLKN